MTLQEYAHILLPVWQQQRELGIPPEKRFPPPPSNDCDSFEMDLEVIRKAMERKYG